MKRMTELLPDGRNVLKENFAYVKNPTFGCFIEGEAIDQLAKYEIAKINDCLLELPFKIGDTVYIISRGDIIPLEVVSYHFDKYGLTFHCQNECVFGYGTITLRPDKRCVEWFKDIESAEQALLKMKD